MIHLGHESQNIEYDLTCTYHIYALAVIVCDVWALNDTMRKWDEWIVANYLTALFTRIYWSILYLSAHFCLALFSCVRALIKFLIIGWSSAPSLPIFSVSIMNVMYSIIHSARMAIQGSADDSVERVPPARKFNWICAPLSEALWKINCVCMSHFGVSLKILWIDCAQKYQNAALCVHLHLPHSNLDSDCLIYYIPPS